MQNQRMEVRIVCEICKKKWKDNDWVEIDARNKVTHCTCNNWRSHQIIDIDTYKNIKNKYWKTL